MFEKGDFALVRHAMRRATEAMATQLESMKLESMTGDERIIAGVRARLEHLAPFVSSGAWAKAMALGALPQHALDTSTELGVTVDELWYLAGDRSADASWYSRRGLLLGVFASTELYMLSDSSEGFADTWDFLQRRVAGALARRVTWLLPLAQACPRLREGPSPSRAPLSRPRRATTTRR